MKALPSLFAISALAIAPSIATASSGITTSVYTTHSSASGEFDNDGNKVTNDDSAESEGFTLIAIGLGYAVNDDLSLSLSLPIVNATKGDASTMALGDASIAAQYMLKLNDMASVGTQVRYKMSTGDTEDLTTPNTGSGFANIQAELIAQLAPMDNLTIGLDAGYVMQTGTREVPVPTEAGIMTGVLTPGAMITANGYFGYEVSGFTPRLGDHYMQLSTATLALKDMPDAPESDYPGSDKNAIGISFDVAYALSDTMGISAGLGTNMLARGFNVPWGMALSGKNVSTGMAFNLGFNAAF